MPRHWVIRYVRGKWPASLCRNVSVLTLCADPSSVGYASAKALMDAGAAYVVLMGRDFDKVAAAIESLAQNPQKCRVDGVTGDLKQPAQMKRIVQEAAAHMGGGFDILVISGGNGGSEYLGMDAQKLDSYRAMYDISVLSPLELTEAASP
jgi:NAD(P)-dependent dehydrogenase (short-subunit alcohol dehydrogenase family)